MKNCFGKKNIYSLFILLFLILTNSCKLDVTQEIPEHVYPIADKKIYINSNPKGFSVFLDNKNMGIKTPDTIRSITEGIHKLVLKHPYFIDTLININTSFTKSLYVDLLEKEAMMSSLFVNSIPIGASIYYDGKDISKKTPITLRGLMPGVHKVKLTANRCRDDSVDVVLYSKTMTQITIELDDTTYNIVYNTKNSIIPSNSIKKIVIDQDNTKWIGSIDKGLFKFSNGVFTMVNVTNPLVTSSINDLLIDSMHGRLWIATVKGLIMYNGVSWIQFIEPYLNNSISSVAEDKNGNIWIGTANGIAMFNNKNWQIFRKENGSIPADDITCITVDNQNNIWVGTSTFGALMFDGTEWNVINNSSGIFKDLGQVSVADFVNSISYDKYKEAIYISFKKSNPKSEGKPLIIKYFLRSWSVFTPPVLPNDVELLYFYSPQTYWSLNENSGLVRVTQDGLLKFFNKSNTRLLANHFTSVAKDLQGDLWFSTMGGGIMRLKY